MSDLDFLDEFEDIQGDSPDGIPESACDVCGALFGPADTGHCSGGKWGGCCQSFASNHAFDKHRTGRYEPNQRRCLTPDELLAKGWAKTGAYDSWRTPPPANNPWKAKQ